MDNIHQLATDYLSGNFTQEQIEQLVELLKNNPEAIKEFQDLVIARSCASIPDFSNNQSKNLNYLLSKIKNKPKKVFRISLSSFWKVAAVIIILISTNLGIYFLSRNFNNNDLLSVYETTAPYGSVTRILLPDSTEIWLNAGSTISYNAEFGKKNRDLKLNGEAHFKVTKNKSLPFYVESNQLRVKVLGTTFNVKAYSEEENITVELIEGHVNILTQKGNTTREMHLYPNENATFNKKTYQTTKSTFNPNKTNGWINGGISFSNEEFAMIAKMLERKYDVSINISSLTLSNERFTGYFGKEYLLEDILKEMDVDHKYTFDIDNKKINIKDKTY